MEFDWVMGCVLGWLVDPKFLLCDWLAWVGSGELFGGLGWVEEIGPTDNRLCVKEFQNVRPSVRLSVCQTRGL